MGKYVKRPLPIEAVQFTGENSGEVMGFCPSAIRLPYEEKAGVLMSIPTLEGDMKANHGDWIIKGIEGEFYPCKPSIFEASYEKAEEDHTKPAFHYRVTFDLTKMSESQVEALKRAEVELHNAGLEFDTGGSTGNESGPEVTRDWEWDWSLHGPISIKARKPAPYPSTASGTSEDSKTDPA